MRRIFIMLITLVVLALLLVSCTSTGLARLPSNKKLFISTSSENGFVLSGTLAYPYQPIGYVKVRSIQLTPCSRRLSSAYKALEKTMVEQLATKAVNDYGADAIINMDWSVTPGVLTTVEVWGLAVKKK